MQNILAPHSLFLSFFLPKILVAIACGAIIGLERELRGKSAGLRTCIIVCLGSCIFSSLAFLSIKDSPNGDPMRVIAQIVSGLGFLGAGVIFRSEGSILGLTTGAVVWFLGAIGAMVGVELYESAIALSLVCVFILVVIRDVESLFISDHKKQYIYYLCYFEIDREHQRAFQEEFQAILQEHKIKPRSLGMDKVAGKIKYSLKYVSGNDLHEQFYYKLAQNEKVHNLEQVKN